MRSIFIAALFFTLPFSVFSQAFFTSKANGNWSNPATWNLVSGNAVNGFPGATDSVIIQPGNRVTIDSLHRCLSLSLKQSSQIILDTALANLSVVNNVDLRDASQINVSAGTLTVTGNCSIGISSINQTGGIITILGFVTANNAFAFSGSSRINVQSGLFNCIGGLNLISPARPTELEIGTGFVTIAGLLSTIGNAAKIRFTGDGTLTLAGLITLTNNNFVAGTGRVVYVGIPGTDQAVASLNYHRLVITGIGGGIKTISGNVNVADSLVLLTDTLKINSGSLTMAANTAIVRTAGKILSAPNFAGQVDLIYNNALRDTTGPELPANPATLRNLTIANPGGILLNQSATVNNKFILTLGELSTGTNILFLKNTSSGSPLDPAIDQTNGYVSGTIERTISTTTGSRYFPFGIASVQGGRGLNINCTTPPSNAGSLKITYVNNPAPNESGLPINADGTILDKTLPFCWTAQALNGLAGGNYSLTLNTENVVGVTELNAARIVKRNGTGSQWILDGVAGLNTGTNTSPVVNSTNMSGFSDFTIAYRASAINSVRDLLRENKIQVYPNPVKQGGALYFSISESLKGIYEVRLQSINGSEIISRKINHSGISSSYAIDLSDIHSKGLYIISLYKENKNFGSGLLLIQ